MLKEELVVSKSKTLIEATFPTWEAATIDVFDTYLSRINPMDPNSSEVVFTKAEYEKLLGIKEIRVETLNKSLTEFMRNTVSIESFDAAGNSLGWDNYCLFEKTSLKKNELGEWEVSLRCNSELKTAFFELKERGYQKYQLKDTLSLTHKATKLLYFILLDHRYGNYEWTVELPELRTKLGIGKKKYESFKDFNKYILKKAKEEINEKTSLKFTYEPIKRGRLTRAIKFKILKNQLGKDVLENVEYEVVRVEKQIEGQMNIYNDFPDAVPVVPKWHQSIPGGISEREIKVMEMYAECCAFEFTWEEMVVIVNLIPPAVEFRQNHMGIDDISLNKADYLSDKYAVLNAKKDVKSRYGMMCSIVENDWKK